MIVGDIDVEFFLFFCFGELRLMLPSTRRSLKRFFCHLWSFPIDSSPPSKTSERGDSQTSGYHSLVDLIGELAIVDKYRVGFA